VTDTGPGIRPDILPRLFEPFATGKETGLGLGLVISKRIVEEHGGTIRGSNPPGGGACFTVRLPVSEAKWSSDAHALADR
jgi:signal transduction histidine kinase